MRPKFRETLWFKKGKQDESVRDEARPADVFAPNAVDSLPIEDRYADDGSLALVDSVSFGVHTGRTEYMPRPQLKQAADVVDQIDEKQLVVDLKRGRVRVLAAMGGLAVLAIAFVVVMIV